ncbi:hypothetical protein GGR57DRAFT_481638 [Xylariaceae sp. FL1272]|nr:hypothetical protein GGR57DRAFT_481638 [Xylariaceae sp. FL1272]
MGGFEESLKRFNRARYHFRNLINLFHANHFLYWHSYIVLGFRWLRLRYRRRFGEVSFGPGILLTLLLPSSMTFTLVFRRA